MNYQDFKPANPVSELQNGAIAKYDPTAGQLAKATPDTLAVVQWLAEEVRLNPSTAEWLSDDIEVMYIDEAWALGDRAWTDLQRYAHNPNPAPQIWEDNVDWDLVGDWLCQKLNLQLYVWDNSTTIDSHDLTYVDSHDSYYQDNSQLTVVTNNYYYQDNSTYWSGDRCGCSSGETHYHYHEGDRRSGNPIYFYLGVLVIALVMCLAGLQSLFYVGTDLFPRSVEVNQQ